MKGRIHSIETMGLVDGPGIRFVAFFQGCRLRCAYCHNPDTWSMSGGKMMDAQELFQKTLRYRPYFNASGGGVTCSGGEPLMQPAFLRDYLAQCKSAGIHTALDTAGYGAGDYVEILALTDLVILDLKHYSDTGYRDHTGAGMDGLLKFKNALDRAGTRLWLRHVVVPEVTDSADEIGRIKQLAHQFGNVEKIELLPYHTLGAKKYEAMGIKYRLETVGPMSRERVRELNTHCVSLSAGGSTVSS